MFITWLCTTHSYTVLLQSTRGHVIILEIIAIIVSKHYVLIFAFQQNKMLDKEYALWHFPFNDSQWAIFMIYINKKVIPSLIGIAN